MKKLLIFSMFTFVACKNGEPTTVAEPIVEKQVIHNTAQEDLIKEYYFVYIQAVEPRLDIKLEQYATQPTYRIITDTVDYCSPIEFSEGIMSIDQRTFLKDQYENEIQNKINSINRNLYINLAPSNWTQNEIKQYQGKILDVRMMILPNYTEASEARHHFMK